MLSDRCPVCLSLCNVGIFWQTVRWIKMKLGIEVGSPRPHCVQWGPSSTHVYCGQTAGCIRIPLGTVVDLAQATLYQIGAQLPYKGHTPQFSANVCCGQTAGSIKMQLGTEIGLGPGDTVLDGVPAPPKRGTTPPIFSPMSTVAKRSPISATAELLFKMKD